MTYLFQPLLGNLLTNNPSGYLRLKAHVKHSICFIKDNVCHSPKICHPTYRKERKQQKETRINLKAIFLHKICK